MTGIYPERLDSGSNTHVYARDTRSTDGLPLDAGTVQIHLCNDLGHLAAESTRHLVSDYLNRLTKISGDAHGFQYATDAAAPSSGGGFGSVSADTPSFISWAQVMARRYGPFFLANDRVGTDGSPIARKVRVRAQCLSGTTGSLSILAMLASEVLPDPVACYAFGYATAPTSAGSVTIDLAPTAPTQRMAVRVAGTASSTAPARSPTVTLSPAYLWVGWYSTNASDYLYSLSAWELSP